MGLGLSTDWWQSMLCSLFTSIMPPALLLIASPKRGSLGLKRTARVSWNWNNFRGMILSMEAPKLLWCCRQTWNVSTIRFILFHFVLFLFTRKGALTSHQTCDHRRKTEQKGKKVTLTDHLLVPEQWVELGSLLLFSSTQGSQKVAGLILWTSKDFSLLENRPVLERFVYTISIQVRDVLIGWTFGLHVIDITWA